MENGFITLRDKFGQVIFSDEVAPVELEKFIRIAMEVLIDDPEGDEVEMLLVSFLDHHSIKVSVRYLT